MKASADQIATVLSSWLQAEIEESDRGRNAPLSDFKERKADFSKLATDSTNYHALKSAGHFGRLRLWVNSYASDRPVYDDWETARLLFGSLMFVSGNYRAQCFLASDTADEYRAMRHEAGPTGIDVESVVAGELVKTRMLSDDPQDRLDHMLARTLAVNIENFEAQDFLLASTTEKQTSEFAALTNIETVQAMQRNWVSLATAQIMVAASFRQNDYAEVPFLEAKSITDVGDPIYPFALYPSAQLPVANT